MHIEIRSALSRVLVSPRKWPFAVALSLALAGLAPLALAQGVFSPAPKGPPPAPVAPVAPAPAPAPHVVAPNVPIPPPVAAPVLQNPLANQPRANNQDDAKRSASAGSGKPLPQATAGTPIQGTPVGLDHDPGGNLVSVQTDNAGSFSFGKLAPGKYSLVLPLTNNLFGNGGVGGAGGSAVKGAGSGTSSGNPQPQSVLIALLLPAVQKVREAAIVEHRVANSGDALKIALLIGKDGRIMTLDWGDGKGAVDLAKEAKYIPLPQDASPGELRGTLTSLPSSPLPQALDSDPIKGIPSVAYVPGKNPGGTLTSLPSSPSPQATVKPIAGTEVGLERDPGNSIGKNTTDGHGNFSFGKLAPGNYALKLSGKDVASQLKGTTGTNATAQPQEIAVLIGLLLPAVQTARLVEHPIPRSALDKGLKIAFRIGQDGRMMSLDWGDGKGPFDPEQEARNLPLSGSPGSGEVRGTLAYTGTTTVNPGVLSGPGAPALRRQYEPILIRKNLLAGGVSVAAGDVNGDGVPEFKVNADGSFGARKLAPGEYLLRIADNASPQPTDRPLLIGLLLPAVQKVREAAFVEHRFPNPGDARNISFRMGKDGRVMTIDWGDGHGAVDLAKEAKYLPLPQNASPGELRGTLTSLPSSPLPQALDGDPIPGVDIKLGKDPGGALTTVLTDGHGNFAFGKLTPGNYALKLSGNDLASRLKGSTGTNGTAQPQEIAVLIGLLLPAVQTARFVEHPIPASALDKGIKIAFRVGKDGRIMSLDWGDGKGPFDPEQEARSLPLPKGPGSGEVRGTLAIFDRWGNL